MAVLRSAALTRRPWFEALDFSLEPGEIVALRGPSGAGKSLLLRSIADLDPVDAGELWLDDRARSEFAAADWRRNVLYVHQAGVRLPGTVASNLARIARLAHVGRAVTPVPGLDASADAERLSGGEAQRLALHRALLVEPRVLLLDEATSALDAAGARECEERIRAYVAGGRAALWITHDGALVERVADRELTPWV